MILLQGDIQKEEKLIIQKWEDLALLAFLLVSLAQTQESETQKAPSLDSEVSPASFT